MTVGLDRTPKGCRSKEGQGTWESERLTSLCERIIKYMMDIHSLNIGISEDTRSYDQVAQLRTSAAAAQNEDEIALHKTQRSIGGATS